MVGDDRKPIVAQHIIRHRRENDSACSSIPLTVVFRLSGPMKLAAERPDRLLIILVPGSAACT